MYKFFLGFEQFGELAGCLDELPGCERTANTISSRRIALS
jgi:hypothetical protein